MRESGGNRDHFIIRDAYFLHHCVKDEVQDALHLRWALELRLLESDVEKRPQIEHGAKLVSGRGKFRRASKEIIEIMRDERPFGGGEESRVFRDNNQ